LQPGEFKVYGSSQVTLAVGDVNLEDIITVFPNPVRDAFKINTLATKVAIYDISGRLIKSFKGNFAENESYDISDLKSALYLVRITSDQGVLTKKVFKN